MHNNYTLDEWLAYIETAHSQVIDMSLDRVRQVYKRLSLDFENSCLVTVAGTNGKGTTCRFIEQTCIGAALSAGVFSSPHINRFNERIRVDGKDVSDAQLCAAFAVVYEAAQGSSATNSSQSSRAVQDQDTPHGIVSLSYFEYATLCAFVIFAQAKLNVWIIEVGLGGRLDASNIIDAHIGVITSIGLDHQAYLGDTLEAIAGEKAGIIKPAQKVVIGYPNMQNSVKDALTHFSSQALVCDKDFGMGVFGNDPAAVGSKDSLRGWLNIDSEKYEFSLQNTKIPPQNVLTALAAISYISNFFTKQHPFLVPTQQVQRLVDNVSVTGRFETVSQSPHIIVDVAHNEDSAKYLLSRVQQMSFTHCHIIIGMLKDKNIEATIDVLSPLKATWYCVDLPGPRGEKAQRLQSAVRKHQQAVNTFESVSLGLKQAVKQCKSNDIIIAVGSFILAAHFMQALNEIKG